MYVFEAGSRGCLSFSTVLLQLPLRAADWFVVDFFLLFIKTKGTSSHLFIKKQKQTKFEAFLVSSVHYNLKNDKSVTVGPSFEKKEKRARLFLGKRAGER